MLRRSAGGAAAPRLPNAHRAAAPVTARPLMRAPCPSSPFKMQTALVSAPPLAFALVPRRLVHADRRKPGAVPPPPAEPIRPLPAVDVATPEYKEYVAALANPNPKFAVVQFGGHQYKVTPGDVLLVNKIEADVASKIVLTKILLAGSRSATAVGTPILTQAEVHATVEEQTLTDKLWVFKKRRRKSSQRTRGGRHPATVLRITDVKADAYNL